VIAYWRELLEVCIIIYIKDNEMKTGDRQGMWHREGEGKYMNSLALSTSVDCVGGRISLG